MWTLFQNSTWPLMHFIQQRKVTISCVRLWQSKWLRSFSNVNKVDALGLEKWLKDQEHLTLLRRTWVQVPGLTLWLPTIPVRRDPPLGSAGMRHTCGTPREMQHASLSTPDMEPMPDHCRYHLSPAWGTKSFIEITYRNMGEGVIYRSRNDSKTAVSLKPIPAYLTACQGGNLEHITQPASDSTSWECPFSVDLNLFPWFSWFLPLPIRCSGPRAQLCSPGYFHGFWISLCPRFHIPEYLGAL